MGLESIKQKDILWGLVAVTVVSPQPINRFDFHLTTVKTAKAVSEPKPEQRDHAYPST